MQTDRIPFPYISGLSDTQKLQEVITYLTQLVEELKRQLASIDTTNMIPEVAEKIEKCITEETDLSEYALKTELKSGLATKSNVGHGHDQYATDSDLNSLSSALASHNHDDRYSKSGHTHGQYAFTDHTHSGYAKSSHSHPGSDLDSWYGAKLATESWVKSYVSSMIGG